MKKYITSIFILLFILIFSFYSSNDYLVFYKNETKKVENQTEINKNKTYFTLQDIQDLKDVSFYYTPYKWLLDDIVSLIDNSKNRVYIEVYMFTEKRLQESIIKAKKRWVDVKVVLEKNPYNAYNINNKTSDLLKKNNIEVIWSDTKNYSLNHSKFLIIDDEIILSSGNLTYSTFAYNRDFFFFIKNKGVLETFIFIFENDFIWNKISPYHTNLVLSPDYSRKKLETMILSAKTSLDIYFQYLKDEHMFSLLIQKAEQGIDINIILADTAQEDNKNEIEKLRKLWVKVELIKTPKIHAKAILVDKTYLFMWSENFSTYSLDKNREVWLIIKDKTNISKFIDIFKKDISR